MTQSLLPRFGLGVALLAVLSLGAAFSAPETQPVQTQHAEAQHDEASGDIVTALSATHRVKIQYLDARGDYRRAKIVISPLRQGVQAPWRGQLQAVHIAGLKPLSPRDAARFREAGFRQTANFLSSGHTTGFNFLMPAPNNLKRIWLRGERGSIVSFRIWTRNHNPSTYADEDGDDGDDKPTEPAPDDPGDDGGGDDDDGDGDDDDCGPIPAGCEVYNPWTCECDIGLEDPWGDEAQFEGANGGFSF